MRFSHEHSPSTLGVRLIIPFSEMLRSANSDSCGGPAEWTTRLPEQRSADFIVDCRRTQNCGGSSTKSTWNCQMSRCDPNSPRPGHSFGPCGLSSFPSAANPVTVPTTGRDVSFAWRNLKLPVGCGKAATAAPPRHSRVRTVTLRKNSWLPNVFTRKSASPFCAFRKRGEGTSKMLVAHTPPATGSMAVALYLDGTPLS